MNLRMLVSQVILRGKGQFLLTRIQRVAQASWEIGQRQLLRSLVGTPLVLTTPNLWPRPYFGKESLQM